MKKILTAALMLATSLTKPGSTEEKPTYALLIHGGAGTITRENLSADMEEKIRAALAKALTAGQAVLSKGGTALDAVEAAILILENAPYFNAGRGAVFTAEGKNELDAAIMDGQTRDAGSITGVTTVKNPILLARAVMEKSPHVMLSTGGAEAFAASQGFKTTDPEYFFTKRRWEQLQAVKAGKSANRDPEDFKKFGTVGAVALDQHGHVAAGTSTGGLTAKQYGRVGDTPIIGAGTYADDRSCAVSATGQGEYFIRAGVAMSICHRVQYLGEDLQTAADQVIHKDLSELGGTGGVIAISPDGQMVMSFNTTGMYRGQVSSHTDLETAIYKRPE